MGDETRTILRTNNIEKCYGRLRVLSKVAYLYDQCRNWDKAQGAYFAIISNIEEGDATWNSSFGHYDMMCTTPHMEGEGRQETNKGAKSRFMSKKEFYCKDFQKGECNTNAPHRAWVKNSYELVEHFCLQCWRAKQGKLNHVPNNEECSQRK